MAYAVVKTDGKQRRMKQGDRLKLDLRENEVGSDIVLDEVLLLGGDEGVKVGQPVVAGASVTAKVVRHGKGPKVRVFKRKRRKGFHKTIGHRQPFTEVEVTAIAG